MFCDGLWVTWLLLCSSAGSMRQCRRERPCEKFQRFTEASRLPVRSSQGWCGLHVISLHGCDGLGWR